jgi:cell division protein FtsX
VKNELDDIRQNDETYQKNERYIYLKKIHDDLEKNNVDSSIEKFKEINDAAYMKKWNKLSTFHKIHKIREYLDIKIPDEKKRNEVMKTIEDAINEGKLCSCKDVTYDQSERVIKKIIISKNNII